MAKKGNVQLKTPILISDYQYVTTDYLPKWVLLTSLPLEFLIHPSQGVKIPKMQLASLNAQKNYILLWPDFPKSHFLVDQGGPI